MDEELAITAGQLDAVSQTPRFETEAYREAKREALLERGLRRSDEPEQQEALEDLTVEEHYQRIKAGSAMSDPFGPARNRASIGHATP